MWMNRIRTMYDCIAVWASYVRVWHVAVFVAGWIVLTMAIWLIATQARCRNARLCATLRRFCRRHGDVTRKNAVAFVRVFGRRLPGRMRRKLRAFLRADMPYAGSQMEYDMNQYISRARKQPRGIWISLAMLIGIVQGWMLIRGMEWTAVYVVTSAIATVFVLAAGIRAAIGALICLVDRRNAERLQAMLHVRIRLGNVDAIAPIAWEPLESTLSPTDRYRLSEKVDELLDMQPPQPVVEPLGQGVELLAKTQTDEDKQACLQSVMQRLHQYCTETNPV